MPNVMLLKDQTNEELMIIYRDENPELAFEAFTLLFHRTSEKLFSYIKSKIKNTEEAEDILQKTYSKVHESKHLYNEKYKFEQWIYVIARNLIFDEWRKNKSDIKKLKSAQEVVNINSSIQNAIQEELKIDNDQRELLELKYIDELSYQEISKILHKSEVSLRKTVSRIIKKINWS